MALSRGGLSDGGGGGGVTDHGALTGLSDDDHTQYLLVDGTRNGTGAWINAASLTARVASVGTGTNDGLVAENQTAAAAGAQQYSPLVRLSGRGWKTNATAASQAVEFASQVRPVQGAAAPTGALHWLSQINGGGWTSRANLDSTGLLTALAFGLSGASATLPTSGMYSTGSSIAFSLSSTKVFEIGSAAITINTNITAAGGPQLGASGSKFANGFFGGYLEFNEMADPGNAPANMGRIYMRDNGGGKTQFVAVFPSGAVQAIATEP